MVPIIETASTTKTPFCMFSLIEEVGNDCKYSPRPFDNAAVNRHPQKTSFVLLWKFCCGDTKGVDMNDDQ